MFLEVGEQALINQTRAMMMREDCRDVLSKITCPTLIIHAAEDKRFSLEMHEEMRDAIAHAKLSVIHECGHMSPMERPLEVTGLLRDWLVSDIKGSSK